MVGGIIITKLRSVFEATLGFCAWLCWYRHQVQTYQWGIKSWRWRTWRVYHWQPHCLSNIRSRCRRVWPRSWKQKHLWVSVYVLLSANDVSVTVCVCLIVSNASLHAQFVTEGLCLDVHLLLITYELLLIYYYNYYYNSNNNRRGLAVWLSVKRIVLDQHSCTTSDLVSTRMGDRLWTIKPSRYVTSQLGRLSLLPSVGL